MWPVVVFNLAFFSNLLISVHVSSGDPKTAWCVFNGDTYSLAARRYGACIFRLFAFSFSFSFSSACLPRLASSITLALLVLLQRRAAFYLLVALAPKESSSSVFSEFSACHMTFSSKKWKRFMARSVRGFLPFKFSQKQTQVHSIGRFARTNFAWRF